MEKNPQSTILECKQKYNAMATYEKNSSEGN